MAKKVCSFTAHKFLPCFLCLTTVMLTGTASRPPKRVEDNKGNFMNYLYLLLLCLTVVVFSCQGDTAFDDASDEDNKSIPPKLRPLSSASVPYDEYLRTGPQFQGGVSQRTTRSFKDVVNISIAQNIGGTLEHQIRSITKQQKKAAAQEEEGGGGGRSRGVEGSGKHAKTSITPSKSHTVLLPAARMHRGCVSQPTEV